MTQRPIAFMNNNYIGRLFTYSSQVSGFAAANVYNTSRSKVWKTGGNFEITALNNLIYINDGTNKTITLTGGVYTYATLAAHIQTQLNASSSNWTCTYNNTTTFKFTIDRSSGTEILRQTQTTNAAWDTLGYTLGTDAATSPFIADEQRNHTSEWVQCDLGVPQQATFVGILGAIDSLFTLSAVAVVKVKASNLDSWTSPPVDVTIAIEGGAAMAFIDTVNTTSYRYWRVEIVDRENYLGPEGIEIGYIYVGDHTTISTSNVATGFSKSLRDPSNVLQSESGALFFETRPRYMTISGAQIQLLSGNEYDEIEQLFYDLGIGTPFFVSLDPGLQVSRKLIDLTRFVVMASEPELQHVIRDYYNISFEMREAF